MKKLLSLKILLLVFAGCSSSLDESKILANYTNSKYYQSIKKMEQKQNKNEAEYIQLAIDYHDLANESKDIDVTNLMIKKIAQIRDEHFNNPVITAFYGSVYSMIGRDSSNPVSKISAVKDGISYIDEAVAKDSSNIHLRILRAEHAISLPSFFDRINIAVNDYQFLTSGYENKKIKLEKKDISMIYCHQGDALKKVDKIKDAVVAWKKCLALDSQSEYAQAASKMLSIYDED